MKYIQKGYKLDSEVNDEINYLLGATYHRLGQVDSAKKHYLLFKEEASKNIQEIYTIDNLITQCDYLKWIVFL